MSTPDLKTRWVKALRSGRYKQAYGRLADVRRGGEANCCLGVLCRVAREREPWRTYTNLTEFHGGRQLRKRLGMTREQEEKLGLKNDLGGSFAEIADWIEANL